MNPHGPPKSKRPPLPNGPGHGRPKGRKNKLTVERIEQEIRRLALFDPIQLFDRAANGQRTFTLRALADMDPDTRACIASIKVRTENLTAGDKAQDQTVEIKLWDKVKALEMCAKHFKWIDEKLRIEVTEDTLARLDAWKQRNREQADESKR